MNLLLSYLFSQEYMDDDIHYIPLDYLKICQILMYIDTRVFDIFLDSIHNTRVFDIFR